MNSGGSTGPDDFGLPPVDVEIPDDARELDRDVQAYHRELRALRRQMRARRLHAPLARGGMVLPLLAACLALTLLAGTLLTVFTAGGAPFTTSSRRAGKPLAQGRVGGRLPNAHVLVGGQEESLRSLTAAVLVLVPPNCRCQVPLGQLAQRASQSGAHFYVVGIHGARITQLTAQIGLLPANAVQDPGNVLVSYFRPAGLTAILVRTDGTVAAVTPVPGHAAQLAEAIRALPAPSPQGLGGGGGTPLASAAPSSTG